MRKAVAVALSLAVQMAAWSAPLVHSHPDEHATAHHGGRAVHTHWHGHSHAAPSNAPSNTPAIEAPDHDRAVPLAAFVAAPQSTYDVAAAAPSVFSVAPLAERAAHPSVAIAPGHDPPVLAALSPRPPPAPPVLI